MAKAPKLAEDDAAKLAAPQPLTDTGTEAALNSGSIVAGANVRDAVVPPLEVAPLAPQDRTDAARGDEQPLATDERRTFALECAVHHDGEELRENDAVSVTEPQFEALRRAGAIHPDAVWLDGEIEEEV